MSWVVEGREVVLAPARRVELICPNLGGGVANDITDDYAACTDDGVADIGVGQNSGESLE